MRDVFWGPGPSEKFHDLSDAKGTELWAPWVRASCLVLFGLWPRLLMDFIDPTTATALQGVVGLAGRVAGVAP